MTDRKGYRGYITSRPIRGQETPHQVQNMVVRDYCRRNGFLFRLSATEYSVDNCFMMLTDVLNTISECQGIVLYSQFLLPPERDRRRAIYRQILAAGAELHAALENASITTEADIVPFDDTIAIVSRLPAAPMAGHYVKSGQDPDLQAFRTLVL